MCLADSQFLRAARESGHKAGAEVKDVKSCGGQVQVQMQEPAPPSPRTDSDSDNSTATGVSSASAGCSSQGQAASAPQSPAKPQPAAATPRAPRKSTGGESNASAEEEYHAVHARCLKRWRELSAERAAAAAAARLASVRRSVGGGSAAISVTSEAQSSDCGASDSGSSLRSHMKTEEMKQKLAHCISLLRKQETPPADSPSTSSGSLYKDASRSDVAEASDVGDPSYETMQSELQRARNESISLHNELEVCMEEKLALCVRLMQKASPKARTQCCDAQTEVLPEEVCPSVLEVALRAQLEAAQLEAALRGEEAAALRAELAATRAAAVEEAAALSKHCEELDSTIKQLEAQLVDAATQASRSAGAVSIPAIEAVPSSPELVPEAASPKAPRGGSASEHVVPIVAVAALSMAASTFICMMPRN